MTEQAQIIAEHCPTPGFAIDIGANDGIFLSNTLELEKVGWRVLCIEPNPYYGTDLWVNRKEVVMGACGKENASATFSTVITENNKYAGYSGLVLAPGVTASTIFEVQVRTLDWYLEKWAPPQLDFLTVDVEGGELNVLAGFDIARWRPKIICLEDWTMNNVYEGVLPGYTLLKRVSCDHIYVRNDEI